MVRWGYFTLLLGVVSLQLQLVGAHLVGFWTQPPQKMFFQTRSQVVRVPLLPEMESCQHRIPTIVVNGVEL